VGHFWELRSSVFSVVSFDGFLRSGRNEQLIFVINWYFNDVHLNL
jgi:hypothetical protein